MKTNLSLLFLLCVVPGIQASEAPRPTPTIDFSSKTLKELVEYKRSNNLEALTPRSNQSYTDRFKALATQGINDVRAALGITPEMIDQAQQRPTPIYIFVPAAAMQGFDRANHGPHNPHCICDLLDRLMPRQGAPGTVNREDMTTQEATQNEEPTTDELNMPMKNMNFKKE
jgi:hypothetical protein